MIIRSKLIPVAALWVAAIGLSPGTAASAPSQADIPYATSATGEPLKLDLYLPESAGAPPATPVAEGEIEIRSIVTLTAVIK